MLTMSIFTLKLIKKEEAFCIVRKDQVTPIYTTSLLTANYYSNSGNLLDVVFVDLNTRAQIQTNPD